MSNITRNIPFPFVLLILLFIKGSVSLESKSQGQAYQLKKTPETSKILEIAPDYGKLPLYFIPNEGQVDEKALFYAKASRYILWLTKEGLIFDSTRRMKKDNTEFLISNPRYANEPEIFTYERDVSRLLFLNSNKNPDIVQVSQTKHKVNYFLGKDKSKWRTNIQTSKAVLYKELYRNIDLKVCGVENQIEYDFIVKPGGEVSNISFGYENVEKTEMDKEGDLVIKTEFGEVKHAKPVCYQIIEEERVEVEANFKKIENNNYGFKVKGYNKNYELIIDPLILIYSTYLGGSRSDIGYDIAVDSEGTVYVTGYTESFDFPTQNSFQGIKRGGIDVFITKMDSSGSFLIFSTYLGGSRLDVGHGIAVDTEGAAYVTGNTLSTDFPTQNPFQRSRAGSYDAFITKINASGDALIYSTFLGGSEDIQTRSMDFGYDIAVDTEGAAYVTGYTGSPDFPTQNPFQRSRAGSYDAFITKINASGDALIYSTFLGGSDWDYGHGIAVDTEGAAYVTGYTGSLDFPTQNPFQRSRAGSYDAFITKINASGDVLIYSTYLGGSSGEIASGIAVDLEGAAYVTGYTESLDFPTQYSFQGSFAGKYDAFITKINASGDALIYSTYLGGSDWDYGNGIAVDSEGAVYVKGETESIDFPIQNPFQGNNAGYQDAFITKINASGDALIYSTYLGGSSGDFGLLIGCGIAVDTEGAAYVTGYTGSPDFPTQNPFQEIHANGWNDVFITKLCDAYSLTITTGKGGTTDPSPGTYTYCSGTEAIIEAISDMHYRFSHWSGDVSGSDNPITINLDSDKSIEANFVRIIYPPLNFAGQKVLNRSLSQAEYINVLTWRPNPNNVHVMKYRIYQLDGENKILLIELNFYTFKYWHRRVEKNKPYTYAICAVNDEDREGDPTHITVQ